MVEKKTKKYEIILADPPWRYQDKNCNGNCRKHYNTMNLTLKEKVDIVVGILMFTIILLSNVFVIILIILSSFSILSKIITVLGIITFVWLCFGK